MRHHPDRMTTYHATSYHRATAPRSASFSAPDDAPPLELLRRAALTLGVPRSRPIPTSHLAAGRSAHSCLIVHTLPEPPPDPYHLRPDQAHALACRYRLAHQAHKDALQANPGRAARLAETLADLHGIAAPLAYRATLRRDGETDTPAGVTLHAPAKATRRQLVQRAKRALHITGLYLRAPEEYLSPTPRIVAKDKGATLEIRPAKEEEI